MARVQENLNLIEFRASFNRRRLRDGDIQDAIRRARSSMKREVGEITFFHDIVLSIGNQQFNFNSPISLLSSIHRVVAASLQLCELCFATHEY